MSAPVLAFGEYVFAVILLSPAVFLSEPLSWVTGAGGVAVVAAGIMVARMAPVAAAHTG